MLLRLDGAQHYIFDSNDNNKNTFNFLGSEGDTVKECCNEYQQKINSCGESGQEYSSNNKTMKYFSTKEQSTSAALNLLRSSVIFNEKHDEHVIFALCSFCLMRSCYTQISES